MADDSQFAVKVVTPERVLLDGTATEVILRTGDGDITFLAGHTPLVGTIEPGVIRVIGADGPEVRVASHGGFVQVEQNVPAEDGAAPDSPPSGSGTRVTLLVGVAELAEEIDIERAQTALAAAEARVSELGGGAARSGEDEQPDVELTEAEAALRRAQVRIEAVDVTTGSATGTAAGSAAGS